MRLTNTIRDAFVKAVMDDVPHTDYNEQIRSLLSKEVIRLLPEKVRTVWEDPKLKGYIHTNYHRFGTNTSINYPSNTYDGYPVLSVSVQKEAQKLQEIQSAQFKLREDLRSKIHAAAYGCTTRKQLAELLPEFDKYLPADEKAAVTKNLPAVANILSDFVKAGWPKNQPKMPKKP